MNNIAKNDITGKVIKTEPTNSKFREGWDNIFNKEAITTSKLILASATWCGPCHGLKKRLKDNNLYDKVEVKDADKDRDFFKEHNIKAVPRLIVIKDTGEIEQIQGADDIYKSISNYAG